MSGIFDFIKKTQTNASPAQSQPQVVQSQSQPQVVQSQPTSYNGIGNPSGGQSYNGIGSPPSGQSYNGIGAPPAPVVVQAPIPPPVIMSEQPASNQSAQQAPQPQSSNTNNNQQPQQNQNNQNGQNSSNQQSGQNQQNSQNQQNNQQNNQQKNDEKSIDPKKAGAALNSNLDSQKRGDLDVMTHLTQRSNRVFMSANNKAKEMQSSAIDTEHLLAGLLTDGEIYKLLTELKVQPQVIEGELKKAYKKEASKGPLQPSPKVKKIIDNSLVVARKMGYEFISPEHLLLATYEETDSVAAQILTKQGLKKEDLNKKVTGKKEGLEKKDGQASQPQKTALQQFCTDLTEKAAKGELDPVVERSDVVERVVHILSRRMKNNPALIGEPGVGKTAVVEGLAQRIVDKQVPESLLNKKILVLDMNSVIAGASHRGEFEERMKNLVEELKSSKGKVIMFIDEVHTIVGAGGGGDSGLDASNFLKPALSRAEVQLIGATTITEYRKYIEKDAALERRFQTVVVPEPTEEASVKMLKAAREKFETFHKVKIPDDTIELAVKLSKRYIGDRFLPDKAFDLMDEAAAAVRLPLISLPEEMKSLETRIAQLTQEKQDHEKKGEKVKASVAQSKIDDVNKKLKEKKDEYNMKKAQTTTAVSLETIKNIISTKTGIPISKLTGSEMEKLSKLEETMHKRMIGQERPVAAVAQAVKRGRAGLKSNARPIGSFVFLGPSGVGKTELAKTLAEILFDQEDAIIRFDMTEFMEKHEVAKLLGPPPGYVGYEEGGKLTEAVRRKPYSLILFDEVEKAHPDIFNILLQILDDGRLTDNKGRTISFKNTVIICTSNIGTKMIQEELLKGGKSEIQEPAVISTYTFSPRGREIMTMGNKYFERDAGTDPNKEKDPAAAVPAPTSGGAWNQTGIHEYFAGQKVEVETAAPIPVPSTEGFEKEPVQTEGQDGQPAQTPPAPTEEPAAPQNVSFEFPLMGYDTHAMSQKGTEMITKDTLVFYRASTTSKVWKATALLDYFKDQIVINALPDAPDEQLPTANLKTHAYSPEEMEIITFRDRFWRRKEGTTDWETGMLKDYFVEQKIDKGNFPITHWDIHTFSPVGREVIIVGHDMWYKDAAAPTWTQTTLHEYFGADFPLDKEVEEKNKNSEATDVKKYQIIKDKVMAELLKFFRPELVNRFDEVIVFEPLKFEHMMKIVELQLTSLKKVLLEQELGFTVTEVATKEIVRSGFDPLFGARPLRRAIQKLVENPISELIIARKVEAGDSIIVDFTGEEFLFNIEKTTMVSKDSLPADEKGKEAPKTFFCEKCAKKTTTVELPNSTKICSNCASTKLTEVNEDKAENKAEMAAEKTETKEASDSIQSTQSPPPADVPQGQQMTA